MNKKISNIVTVSLFFAIILVFLAAFILLPKEEYSMSERRKLANFPNISVKTVTDGTAMSGFTKYVADRFPLRDGLRGVKAFLTYDVYRQKDNNGLYEAGGQISKLDPELNDESVERFCERLNRVYTMYPASSVYFALVPDKNLYLAKANGYPDLDYEKMKTLLAEGLDSAFNFIDLSPALSAEDYYETDVHWKSEKLQGVRDLLAEKMSFNERVSQIDDVCEFERPLSGVYLGQYALSHEPDPLRYITNPAIEAAAVSDLDRGVFGGVYWPDSEDRDPYAFFLNGSSSLVTIENPLAQNSDELIVFRDSFASSLAPHLVCAYKKITLIDIRYIAPERLENLVDFASASDVLFLYSSGVVNHSETLK